MVDITLRPGRDSDGPGFVALIGACWAEYPGPVGAVLDEAPEVAALASAMAAKGGAVWTLEQAGAVAGMVATYPAADGWHLSRMYTRPDQRGTGAAASLLAAAQDHARAAGATRMVLWSDVLFTRAHAFYEKHGFVRRSGLRTLENLPHVVEAGFAKPLAGTVVERLDVAAAESAERRLAAILRACVADGASVSFLPPLELAAAMAFWRDVTRSVGQGGTVLLAAWVDGVLAGTVQLGLDTPPNQPHRADLCKLLVDPALHRRGTGRALMLAAQAEAAQAGRTLLTLDTVAGDAGEQLYRSLGWVEAGRIPGYALDGAGHAHATVLFYRQASATGHAS